MKPDEIKPWIDVMHDFVEIEVRHHPWMWGLMLVLILCLMAVFAAGMVYGITIQTHETTALDGYVMYNPSRDCARGPDNIIRHAYPTRTLAVNLSYSANNGTSWTETTILAAAYQGATVVDVRGIVVSSNNTTCILIRTTDADSKYDMYLLVRWGWYGSWVNYHISSHATIDYRQPQLGINGTDVLLILCGYNTQVISYYLFKLSNRDQYPNYGAAPNGWLAPSWSETSTDFQIWANTTGKFWIGWTDLHTYSYINGRDFCATKSLISWNVQTNVYSVVLNGVGVVPKTGEAVFLLGYNYTAYGYAYITVYYLREGKTYFQGPGVVQSFTTEKIFENYMGLSVDATGMVYVFWYSGTNHKVRGMKTYYWETVAEWIASVYDVNIGYTSTDYVNCANGLGSLWPQVVGVPVNTPRTGYFMSWIWKDEKGATDDYNYQVVYNSVTWPYVNWVPPVISNLTTVDGITTYWYIHDFNYSSGNSPVTWWVSWTSDQNHGWFIVDPNGTMYGYAPDTVGTYTLVVHAQDFYGLKDQDTFTIYFGERIPPAPPIPPPPAPASWTVSLDQIGGWWTLLAGLAVVACLFGMIQRAGLKRRRT